METEDFKFIVGKPIEEAKELLKPRYYLVEYMIDGEGQYISTQYDIHRIQVESRRGIVTKINMIG